MALLPGGRRLLMRRKQFTRTSSSSEVAGVGKKRCIRSAVRTDCLNPRAVELGGEQGIFQILLGLRKAGRRGARTCRNSLSTPATVWWSFRASRAKSTGLPRASVRIWT